MFCIIYSDSDDITIFMVRIYYIVHEVEMFFHHVCIFFTFIHQCSVAQGGIIKGNLRTRFPRNLMVSHEILISNPAYLSRKCDTPQRRPKIQKKSIFSNKKKYSCDRKFISCHRKYISCHRKFISRHRTFFL